ncbi:MAG: hypothetical protein BWK78_08980 [Thiotrichaceae bacterium IS1]|nr:MAG: hypothetical protein BWK78_08980 [Thiotrichaceae bacterium IS1]
MDYIKLLQYLMLGFLGIFTGLLIAAVIYYLAQKNQRGTLTVSTILPPLFGRKTEIDRLKGLILTGQSSTVTGVFEPERTAILGYLSDPSHSQTLYGEYAAKWVFSSMDIATLGENSSPADFWQLALRPLKDKFQQNPILLNLYESCSQNQFDEYCLDKLIVQLKQEGWRLVLMLDRFDELLRSPNFKENGKFFATLRKLASSRSPSSLCLIISWGISLQEFHEKTRNLSKGSPYFNFMGEVVLGALSDAEIDNLLNKDFFEPERQFLKEVTGRHPYLLQLAVSALQAAKGRNEKEPLESALKDFSAGVANMLANLIHAWAPKVCKTLVSLVKEGKASELSNEEMSLLEKQGFVMR